MCYSFSHEIMGWHGGVASNVADSQLLCPGFDPEASVCPRGSKKKKKTIRRISPRSECNVCV